VLPADELEDWGRDALADEGVDPDAARKRKGSSSLGALQRAGAGARARRGMRRRRKEDRGGMVRE
jgi:hypothetical protein